MLKLCLILILSFLQTALLAKANLHSHEHGNLKLEIAVEKDTLVLMIDGPADSILGFEHQPKTAKEKKIYYEAQSLWKNKYASLFIVDEKISCQAVTNEFDLVTEEGSKHAEIEAKLELKCSKNLMGEKIKIALIKNFKKIERLSVELVGSQSKKIVEKKSEFELAL